MQSENKLGIVVITYNNPDLLDKQIVCLQEFCKDNYELVVIDNSTEQAAIDAVAYKCKINGLRMIKTSASSKNGSDSHSFAANLSYQKLKNDFSHFLYLDHDCFMVKDFSVMEFLKGKVMAGLGQEKSGITYFWPGCVMWDNDIVLQCENQIDFSPGYGCDTGGMLHMIMREIKEENLIHFDEQHMQNPGFTKSFYNFFCMLNKGTFMHFVNGSGWNKENAHEERINSLFNILTKLCNREV